MVLAPAPTNAEFCRPVMPDSVRNVRGDTFEARVVDFYETGTGPTYTYVVLDVIKVYAAQSDRLRAGRRIDVYINACDGIGLLKFGPGDRLLISTSALDEGDGPATWNSAVWRRDEGILDLLVVSTPEVQKVWYTNDRRIAGATTLREALILVAPGALGLPDSSTLQPTPDGAFPRSPLLLFITFTVVLLAFFVRPPPRRRADVR
jgi:hypothetical protein